MSIGPIETNPLGDDDVNVVDPGDVTVEPSYGHSTKPWDLRTGEDGTGHADPDAENITHVPGVSKSREVDLMEAFDLDVRTLEHGKGTDPDAAFGSGTNARPDTYIHDEALQVRQLIPTDFDTNSYALTPATGVVMLSARRPERMTIVIYNLGPAAAFIARRASNKGGFYLAAGASLSMTVISEVYASCDPAGISTTLYTMEQFRSDVAAS